MLLRHLGQQTRLAKIRSFRRPREWFSPETKHLLLLLEPSYFVPMATKDCLAHSAALAKFSDKIHFRPAHLRLLLLAFPHFSKKEMHEQTNTTRRTTRKLTNSYCRARTLAKCAPISLLVQRPNPLVQALETSMKNELFNEFTSLY